MELGAIVKFVDAVPQHGGALLLHGEPGIGKTRLWQEGVSLARERGILVLSARPAGSEVRLSFATLGDLLTATIEKIAPAIPPVPRDALFGALGLADARESPDDRRAIGLGVLVALETLSRSAPVVIAIDDVQWVDASSARALQFALRRLESRPVGVLFSARDSVRPAAAEMVATLSDLERLTVGPLSVGALHQIVRNELGVSLPRPTLLRLHETSRGNPFYALELARAMLVRGTTETSEWPELPASLADALRIRLKRLSREARETLAVAALLSQPTVEALRVVIEVPDRLDDDLAAAERAGVIEIERDTLHFAHPLLASALLETLARPRLRELHRRIATASADPEQRARHLAAASSSPDANVASELDAAATRARLRGAPEAAAEILDIALRLTPPSDATQIHARRIAAADHYYAAGDSERARTLLESALPLAPRGPERARVLLKLAAGHRGHFERRGELLQSAIQEANGDKRVLAEALCTRALFLQATRDAPTSEADARAALALATEIGDAELLAACRAAVLRLDFLLGRPIRAEDVRQVLAMETAMSPLALEWRWDKMTGAIEFALTTDFESLRAQLEAVCAAARRAGDVSLLGPLTRLVSVEAMLGHRDEAKRHAEEAYDLALQAGLDAAEPMCLLALLALAVNAGEASAARSIGAQCLDACGRTGRRDWEIAAHGELGALELSLGDATAAYEHLRLAHEMQDEMGAKDASLYSFAPLEVEALVGLGQVDRAGEVAEQFARRAQERTIDVDWGLALAAHCRGVVAAAHRDDAAALAAFNEAVTRSERLATGYETARALLALGSWQRRRGRSGAARRSLERAASILERRGYVNWLGRARSELRRIGGRTAERDKLSETERRVAELVASGRSNKEVAAALAISPKTVAWNLTKVYEKLGVGSRAELAARRR